MSSVWISKVKNYFFRLYFCTTFCCFAVFFFFLVWFCVVLFHFLAVSVVFPFWWLFVLFCLIFFVFCFIPLFLLSFCAVWLIPFAFLFDFLFVLLTYFAFLLDFFSILIDLPLLLTFCAVFLYFSWFFTLHFLDVLV